MRSDHSHNYVPGTEQAYGHADHVNAASEDASVAGISEYGSQLRRGMIILMVLILGLGVWAVLTQIQGAVIANGTFIVEGKPKSVQHLNGGIIREIAVKNGDTVEKGDLLMLLDDTVTAANLDKLSQLTFINQAQIARLEAERRGSERIIWPEAIRQNRQIPQVKTLILDQEQLFWTRQELQLSQERELTAAINQKTAEISGVNSTISAKNYRLTSLKEERGRLEILLREQAISRQRVMGVDRDIVQVSGEIQTLKSTIDRLGQSIKESESKLVQLSRDKERAIIQELSDLQERLVGVDEQMISAKDSTFRSEIRAPAAGKVHNLRYTTVNGVIPSGQELMQIIPMSGALIIEARIDPADIDQVHRQQKAIIALSAFHPSKAPQLKGYIIDISADLLRDDLTGKSYYSALIGLNPEELSKLGSLEIIPGMPANAYIQTQKSSVVRYLFKPIENALRASFREE